MNRLCTLWNYYSIWIHPIHPNFVNSRKQHMMTLKTATRVEYLIWIRCYANISSTLSPIPHTLLCGGGGGKCTCLPHFRACVIYHHCVMQCCGAMWSIYLAESLAHTSKTALSLSSLKALSCLKMLWSLRTYNLEN